MAGFHLRAFLRAAASLSDLTSADEVDNLQAVAGGDGRFSPAGALGDLTVVLDGDAVALELHRSDRRASETGGVRLAKLRAWPLTVSVKDMIS